MPIIEQITAAVLAALQGVPGVQLVERNRTSEIPDGMTPAIILFDGDMDGRTDRPDAVVRGRSPTFRMTLEPVIWGYVEASDTKVGTKRSILFAAVSEALFKNVALMRLLAERDGGLQIEGAAFPPPASAPDTAAAVFVLRLGLSFTFDPSNP